MQRLTCKRRLSLFLVSLMLGVPWALAPAYLRASQDLSASGGLRPLSGINQTWLDRLEGRLSWGRNPFDFPRPNQNAAGDNKTPDDEGVLQLSAILYHKEGSVAIINHRVIRPGDSIGARRVISILEDRVVLKDVSGLSELKISPFGAR